MSKPLALVVYSSLLPGSQLANRLQDLGYRVQSFSDPAELVSACQREKPLLALVELSRPKEACAAITQLKATADVAHIPILAFTQTHDEKLQAAAKTAGASLLAGGDAVLNQLPHLLDQILHVE